MPIAYLTSQYPGTSHTFIRREVAALRERGVDVQTFSIRAPTASELKDEAIRDEAGKTFFVLAQPPGDYLVSHLAFAARDLPTYLRVLAVALRHRVPGSGRGVRLESPCTARHALSRPRLSSIQSTLHERNCLRA